MKKYVVVSGYEFPAFVTPGNMTTETVAYAWSTDSVDAAQRVADGLNTLFSTAHLLEPDWRLYRVDKATAYAPV